MDLDYTQTIDFLAEKAGVLPEFEAEGGIYTTSIETKKALLDALGYDATTPENAKKTLKSVLEKPFKRALPPVTVAFIDAKTAQISVTVAVKSGYAALNAELCTEQGKKFDWTVDVACLPVTDAATVDGANFEHRVLSVELPEPGYHTLHVSGDDIVETGRDMTLIVAPERCYMPEMMRDGAKPWGFPVQLYAMRSENNWGIGDFTDLKNMAGVAKAYGADIVGINPINVAFMAAPETASPYYSAGRLFLNPLYIDATAVPEAAACAEFQKYVKSKPFVDAMKKAAADRLVDYTAVSRLKTKAFGILYEDFKKNASEPRRKAFERFCEKGGRELHTTALYQTLTDVFVAKKKGFGFKSWGADYATPDTAASKKFAADNADKLDYYKYLFWLADDQFAAASAEMKNRGLGIGLYQDLAVGVASESAETWGAQGLFATRLSIGSPPDMFNANGQEWGVAPMRPEAMRDEAYVSYRKVLSANMERAGAVRIDHVMGLARLFCIPRGEKGAYLRYNVNDMMGIVALESHRNKCLVVGEDLGVVPSSFREMLEKTGILSFRVFRYEQTEDGRYKPLAYYPQTALVAAGTHDMPTLAGYWLGTDIDVAQKIGLMTDEDRRAQAVAIRLKDRRAMVEALASTGRWFVTPENFNDEINGRALPPRLAEVLYSYLATAPCRLLLVQLEDILGQTEQMNVPGTNSEYPNWRYKLPLTVNELYQSENMRTICAAIRRNR